MELLDLTLDTPAENVALDEALLDAAEASPTPRETLRLWEPAAPFVVVGRNSEVEVEVDVAACRARAIPILRRASGGSAIVAGPGSLMYAVVLRYELRPELRMLDAAHRFVLGRFAAALEPLVPGIGLRGTSDLAVGERKVSGNSLRCRRRAFLYHGTLLYDFSAELVETCLRLPPRQPVYRGGRAHAEFLANLPLTADQLRRAAVDAWQAPAASIAWPRARVAQLVAERYARDAWNHKR